jgi:hypothetical protein
MQGEVAAAHQVLLKHYPTCIKTGSELDFQLKTNEFIELVRKRRIADAISFGKEKLTPFQDKLEYRSKLEVCSRLLAHSRKDVG